MFQQQYLLRIEAVNLEQIMEDTDQLSVIRGGSFMAREGPQSILQRLSAGADNAPFWKSLTHRI